MTLTLMDIIKVDQLSFAARAGALDGSLAYATVYEQHRELVTQTALSGLRGLEQILSETGIYGTAMRSLQEASAKIDEANIEAQKDPFKSASTSQRDQHRNAMINGFRSQGGQFSARASDLDNRAQALIDSTISSNPERTLANDLKWASSELYRLGVGYLVNQGDPDASLHHATLARDAASTVQTKAQTLMQNLSAITPFPSARYDKVNEIYNAAREVVEHANSIIQFDTQSPIARIRNETPTTHDLGGGYSLSTWGNTGYWTLTDANGEGILVHPNGNVDNLKGGAGWKFDTTSTFVLPNQTKITVNPGSPANLLISRGIHAFTIGNLNGGASPSVSSYTDLNGREADRASNDGHILELNGNAGAWRNGGNALGDTGGREVIGTVAISNELRLDPTDVTVSAELKSFLTELGISDYDYDSDGKLNNTELMSVATHTANYIKQMQDAYEQALQRLAKANAVINELNELLDRLRQESDKSAESRAQDSATAKSELQAIERRLVAALQSLQGTDATAPLQGNIETSADHVLTQLTSITQNGSVTPPASNPTVVAPSTSSGLPVESSSDSTSSQGTAPSTASDPIGDSLRRAGRLLSGILGGGNLNILELPTTPPPATQQSPETAPMIIGSATPPAVNAGVTIGQPSEETVPKTGPSESGTPAPNNLSFNIGEPVPAQASSQTNLTPVETGNTATPPLTPDALPPDLQGLADLLVQLSTQGINLPPSASPQNVSLGLQALLDTLSQLGILPSPPSGTANTVATNPLQALMQRLQSVTTGSQESESSPTIPGETAPSIPNQPTIPSTAASQASPSLQQFIEALAQLGSSQQPSPSSTVSPSTTPLAVTVQQLAQLLTRESPTVPTSSVSPSISTISTEPQQPSEPGETPSNPVSFAPTESRSSITPSSPESNSSSSETNTGGIVFPSLPTAPPPAPNASSLSPLADQLLLVLQTLISPQPTATMAGVPVVSNEPENNRSSSLPENPAPVSHPNPTTVGGPTDSPQDTPPLTSNQALTTADPNLLAKTAEQLLRVLQGLAALGNTSSESSQPTATTSPTEPQFRLGLQTFLAALSQPPASTAPPSSQTSSDSNTTTGVSSSINTQAIQVIAGNFQTDPELMKILQENLSKALQTQQRQLSEATTLFTQSQEIVQKFVTLIQEDDLAREVVKSDDLSDEQQALFDGRMTELRKDWGLEWGSDENRTPASQSNLVSRAMQSGMMV